MPTPTHHPAFAIIKRRGLSIAGVARYLKVQPSNLHAMLSGYRRVTDEVRAGLMVLLDPRETLFLDDDEHCPRCGK